MGKQIFKFLIFVALIATLSSCALHNGYMVNSASLSANNFSYQKMNVSGTSAVTYVFLLGGLSDEYLVNDAKVDLLNKNPLQPNQALVNLTIDWRTTYVLPFSITKRCTVAADIVEFK